MNKVFLEEILDYGKAYEPLDSLPYYFIGLDDLEVYKREELIEQFGFTKENFAEEPEYSRFAPLFSVYIPEKEREFLNTENDCKLSEKIKALDDDEMDYFFKIWIETRYGASCRWGEFIYEILLKAAVEWCKELHIPYEQRKVYEK